MTCRRQPRDRIRFDQSFSKKDCCSDCSLANKQGVAPRQNASHAAFETLSGLPRRNKGSSAERTKNVSKALYLQETSEALSRSTWSYRILRHQDHSKKNRVEQWTLCKTKSQKHKRAYTPAKTHDAKDPQKVNTTLRESSLLDSDSQPRFR
jgi:hypothetical protein